jgi:hypothetical protein
MVKRLKYLFRESQSRSPNPKYLALAWAEILAPNVQALGHKRQRELNGAYQLWRHALLIRGIMLRKQPCRVAYSAQTYAYNRRVLILTLIISSNDNMEKLWRSID